jgi:hypothetical protein
MYFSVASRTTHASDTFFSFAIPSKVSYTFGGKLIVARTCAALSGTFLLALRLLVVIVGWTFTAFHHIGEPRARALSVGKSRYTHLPPLRPFDFAANLGLFFGDPLKLRRKHSPGRHPWQSGPIWAEISNADAPNLLRNCFIPQNRPGAFFGSLANRWQNPLHLEERFALE